MTQSGVASRVLFGCALGVMLLAGPVAAGQAPAASRSATLVLTLRDATDLPVPDAEAVLTGASGDERRGTSNERGQVTFAEVPAGTYSVRVAAAGFEPATIPQLSLRPGGRVNRNVELDIAGLVEEISVVPSADEQRLTEAFVSTLTPEQLAALPDDPDEAAAVLQQLIGSDIDLRVNGFAGGEIPRGSEIREVRIRWDAASAGNRGGGPRVEIRTQPGGNRWRGDANFTLRDESLNARNALSNERPAGQTRQYFWRVAGPLVRNRTGLSLSIDRSDAFEQQTIRAATPDGLFSRLAGQPTNRVGFNLEIEHALNSAHEIRAELRSNGSTARNQGVGEFDLPERAFSREQDDGRLRVAHRATFQRRYVNDLRLQFGWRSSESIASSEAQTLRVLDAFTSGGAQVSGGRGSQQLEIEDELEFSIGRQHQVSAGFSVNRDRFAVDERRNRAGTFTFSSLEAFEQGVATSFTQRLGDPEFDFSIAQFGWNIQDNFRPRPNLMLNLGIRHDFQTRLSDWANFSPRVGVNWTPSARRRTTFRGSIGVFHQFFDPGTYEQTLVVNGLQQRDIVISNPGYPDPFAGGVAQADRPPSIVRASPALVMPWNRRWTVGVDQPLARNARVRVNYSRGLGRDQFRSRDANAPVAGARPDPGVRNITELESTARSRNESVDVELSLNYQPRRLSANVRYSLGEAWNETDGALSLPPDSFDLSAEWGPARNDVRHRLNTAFNTNLWLGFRVGGNFRMQSASPYTITTGVDTNGDGANNERPAGTGRNSARGAATKNLDLNLTWGRGFGQRAGVEPSRGGAGGRGGQGGDGPRNPGAAANNLFRIEIFARANNALNLVNPHNYSGVLGSRFFGQPTSVSAARRIQIGTRVTF
jgi:Carboxypeptidase regulatory-like domain